MKFRKKPVVIEATQWFKNGDHPLDYSRTHDGLENGEPHQFSPEERKVNNWEGDIVRYYRHPEVSGERSCIHCGKNMHDHGWIDTLEGGHIVCPRDWIITGIEGEHYPCKPHIFEQTYESAAQQSIPDIKELVEALEGLLAIVSDSSGVVGYHLNGDIAHWREFEEVAMAEEALALCRKEPAPLLTAMRQYRHNHGEGFVFGYDKAETDRIVMVLIEDRNQQYAMKVKAREQRDKLERELTELKG